MSIQIINGDLLEAKERYLCHQCNCLTTRKAGLAYAIFNRFPYADVYSPRKYLHCAPRNLIEGQEPGKIIVCGNGKDQRYVVNMFGQLYPGKPKYPDNPTDNYVARREFFRSCLQALADLPNLESVAFPYGIGCSMAGGNWEEYLADIEKFAESVKVTVVLYKKE